MVEKKKKWWRVLEELRELSDHEYSNKKTMDGIVCMFTYIKKCLEKKER